MVKNLPAEQETQVQSMGQENPLEKEMATHSSILAWKTPWMEEPGRLQSMGLQELDMTEGLTLLLPSGTFLSIMLLLILPSLISSQALPLPLIFLPPL